ncbi:MAG TPA: hypothetical protein VEF04_17765, partial [Blastocatellia bacterium]|nr:hypothetical protein [Blastocatellia bacterium]
KYQIVIIVFSIFLVGCIQVNQSLYKRTQIPKNFDDVTQQAILQESLMQLKQPETKGLLLSRFPNLKESDLMKSDLRWEVFQTADSKTYFISVGVKDVKSFPQSDEFVSYLLELANKAIQTSANKYKGKESNGDAKSGEQSTKAN